jgi:ADP-ribosylglycohydrolase
MANGVCRLSLPLVLLAFALLSGLPVLPAERRPPRQLSLNDLTNRIRGGWAGQMIGVAYGAPTEFKYNARTIEGDLPWSPEMISNALDQDDLYVDMTFNQVLEERGLKASQQQFAEAFANSKYRLWHANLAARENLRRKIKAPHSGHPQHNIHADDIDFQIESDFIGLITPGLPRLSNELCDRVGHIMNYGDGVYGGMFVSAMYGQAFFERNPREVVTKALKVLPAESQYTRLIRDILIWNRQYPSNWKRTWEKVESKWNHKDSFCPRGVLNNFNIDAKLNGAYVAIGLLYGRRDFSQTIEITARCGQDSDCNPASAGGILGTMIGYEAIPEVWKQGIPAIADKKFSYTDYTFNTIVESSVSLAQKAVLESGGKVTEARLLIPYQAPKEANLEQWLPQGQAFVLRDEKDWSWKGEWEALSDTLTSKFGIVGKRTSSPGSEVSCRFSGTGAVLAGSWETAGGRADVYLDGKLQGEIDTSIFAVGGHQSRVPESLWHNLDLEPGSHTLRLVLKEPRNSDTMMVNLTVAGLYAFQK